MPIGIQLLQHTIYRYQDPVWVIHIEITILYSDSTFGYIQLFPVSTSKVFAGMKHKINDKNM